MPYLDLSPDFRPYYRIDDHTDPWKPAETILFVNGFMENLNAWRAWVPYFSRHYRLVRFDLRGFGRTAPVPADFTYTTELWVDDLVRVIGRLAAGGPVHLVAGKSGNISAMRLAATRPDLLKTLSLVCPQILPPPASGWPEHMAQHGVRSWARRTMRGRMGAAMPERAIDWWVDLMGEHALSTAQAYIRWVATIDVRPDMPSIRCPTFVIGTQSPIRTDEENRALHNDLPNAEIVILPMEGYHAGGADPDGTAPLVRDFLDRHRGVSP